MNGGISPRRRGARREKNMGSGFGAQTEGGALRASSGTAIGVVRYPRLVPKDAKCAQKLKARNQPFTIHHPPFTHHVSRRPSPLSPRPSSRLIPFCPPKLAPSPSRTPRTTHFSHQTPRAGTPFSAPEAPSEAPFPENPDTRTRVSTALCRRSRPSPLRPTHFLSLPPPKHPLHTALSARWQPQKSLFPKTNPF